MDGIAELRDRGDLFLRVLGEQDQAKELALEGIMAKNGKHNDADDYATGARPAKDEQMRAMKQAHGTPTRQAELPPFLRKDLPEEKD